MTRVDQALRWWKNNEKYGRIYRSLIPERHRKILVKRGKVQFHYGVVSADDYYELK